MSSETDRDVARDDLQPDDVILGGPEHLVLLRECLKAAKSHVIVHSCFLRPDTIRLLAPDLERAARRGVRVDLLWGLRDDSETPGGLKPLRDSVAQLEAFDAPARDRVQISRLSSNSHCKVIVYDDSKTGTWTSVVGSCNFLSSDFDWIELSVRVRSQRIASRLLGHLIAAQIPASGTWSAVARRLERTWSLVRLNAARRPEQGTHRLGLLVDTDHYAAVTRARDKASADIVVGCDLFGIAAETSVLVPLERAAQLGVPSDLFYHRVTKFLEEKGSAPDPEMLARRGLNLRTIPALHAKFLAWDDDDLAVTSFSWLSTVVSGSRNRGAELGLMVSGPGIRHVLANRLKIASKGKIDVGSKKGLPPSQTAEA